MKAMRIPESGALAAGGVCQCRSLAIPKSRTSRLQSFQLGSGAWGISRRGPLLNGSGRVHCTEEAVLLEWTRYLSALPSQSESTRI